MKAPSARNRRNFVTWNKNEKPLTREESTFWTKHEDDLVALSNELEYGWFDGLVEDTMTFCSWYLSQRTREVLFHLLSAASLAEQIFTDYS